MAVDAVSVRLARLEKELEALDDYAAIRERGLRNEKDIEALRRELDGDVEVLRAEIGAVRADVRDLTRAIVTAALSFALSAIAIVGTLVALFK